MKAGKRIAALVLAGVMVFGNATPAMAANVKDASFKFSAGTKYTASEKRQKTNTTSVYVRVDSSKAKARIQVAIPKIILLIVPPSNNNLVYGTDKIQSANTFLFFKKYVRLPSAIANGINIFITAPTTPKFA